MSRRVQYILTQVPRWWHRKGFGVQSPHDYELVRDVLFERWEYYAYDDLGLVTDSQRQLWRLLNHYRHAEVCYAKKTDDAAAMYRNVAANYDYAAMRKEAKPACQPAAPHDHEHVFIIDGILDTHADLWEQIVADPRARLTFDLGDRGLVLFDPNRAKQSYIL